MKRVAVVDTGAGNIGNLMNALHRCGAKAQWLAQPPQYACDALIIPGQGRFGPVMRRLQGNGWIEYLQQWRQTGAALLGICVGMQILFEYSEEDPGVSGLGWLRGGARKLQSPKQPMMGWADVHFENADRQDFYFVNSYVAGICAQTSASAQYGQLFSAEVKTQAITGCQFHPEKSGQAGMEYLQSWLC